MKVLGISPLDQDATASLVEDGQVRFAAAEERFSRVKQHAGFPRAAIEAALAHTGTSPDEIDVVAYPFLPWVRERALMQAAFEREASRRRGFRTRRIGPQLVEALAREPQGRETVDGLRDPGQRVEKSALKALAYRVLGGSELGAAVATRVASHGWMRTAVRAHRRWQREFESGLAELGLRAKLRRSEHHLAHAAGAYLASGFERALIVTLDGYGSGLAGSIGVGANGRITRLHGIQFPHSLGVFYESVTSALGYNPERHAGKIVGLAAHGCPDVLAEVLRERVRCRYGDVSVHDVLNPYFARHLSVRFAAVDLAAAWQLVLEETASDLVRHWARETGCKNLVLAGGVAANVKMNQRVRESAEVERIFVDPNMGDGGSGTGLARLFSWPGGRGEPLRDVYLGPGYSDAETRTALDAAGLVYERPGQLAGEVARRVHEGEVVARFAGRCEYGPRALGNRSILYHARDSSVNRWLNERLGRTEFMPFAPVTLWEARHRCYRDLEGVEHAAEFMTITVDCTDWMQRHCPAAVHVDGTARPQLLRREKNPDYYDILRAYEQLSGIPCLINTSFNMHEEPIVCTPQDAVRAFLAGHLDALAIGPYVAPHPARARGRWPRRLAKASPGRAVAVAGAR